MTLITERDEGRTEVSWLPESIERARTTSFQTLQRFSAVIPRSQFDPPSQKYRLQRSNEQAIEENAKIYEYWDRLGQGEMG